MSGRIWALAAFAMVWGGLAWWFRRDATPGRHAPFALWMMASALVAGVGLSRGGGWPVILIAGFALAGAAFGVLAATSRRREERAGIDQGVRVGSALPAFRALDENGAPVDGSSFVGAPLLLKFFRGHW